MKINKISSYSSRTFEIPGVHGKSKYIKIQVGAEAELQDNDNQVESYNELSNFIQESLTQEINKIKKLKTNNSIKDEIDKR